MMTPKHSISPPSGGLWSVGGQLAALIGLGLCVAFAIIFTTQIEWSQARSFDEELDRKTYTTELMAAQLYGAVRWRKPDIIQKIYDSIEMHDAGGISAAVTMHRDGSNLSAYAADDRVTTVLEDSVRSYLTGDTSAGPITYLGEDRFTVIAPVESEDGTNRIGAFAISWQLDNLIASTNDVILRQSGIALSSLGGILAAALILIRQRISTPLAEVTEATRRISSGDKKFEIPWTNRRDEIGDMARALVTFRENVALIDRLTADQQAQNQGLHKALEKEREYNALHRDFVSMVSHEFRTPVAIIDGAAQRIDRRAGRDTPEEVQARAGKIRAAVRRMIELIDSTLSVSRLEAGSFALERAPCDLTSLLQEICRRQQEITTGNEITLAIADLPPSMTIDAKRMDQVLTNLLSNAVKYSPNGGQIHVEARQADGQVVISVRDHGLGIPKEEMPMLFSKFFRASTSTGIPGTGIGLHLVKQLVEMHGGSVAANSVKGSGSTFSITLPLQVETPAPRDEEIALPPSPAPS